MKTRVKVSDRPAFFVECGVALMKYISQCHIYPLPRHLLLPEYIIRSKPLYLKRIIISIDMDAPAFLVFGRFPHHVGDCIADSAANSAA